MVQVSTRDQYEKKMKETETDIKLIKEQLENEETNLQDTIHKVWSHKKHKHRVNLSDATDPDLHMMFSHMNVLNNKHAPRDESQPFLPV